MANAKLTAKEKAELKNSAKKVALKEVDMKAHDIAMIKEALKEAKMPVELKDSDFKLGEGELDIRKLSDENVVQMMFRMSVLNVVYGRQITQSLVDIIRLLMLVLKKQGYDDIIKATDDLLAELSELSTKKEVLNKKTVKN